MLASTRQPQPKVVVLLAVLITVCCTSLWLLETKFTLTSMAQVAASPVLPSSALLAFRCCAVAVLVWTIYIDQTDPTPLTITPVRWEGSSLEGASILMRGSTKFITFTVQCWTLHVVYFSGAVCCMLFERLDVYVSPTVSNIVGAGLSCAYETSFACALLTTVCVTFVLIPDHAKRGVDPTPMFFSLKALLMHNANVVLMASELLFNSLAIEVVHFPVCVLWGCYYVLFAWCVLRVKGAVLYPFLDPTLRRAVLLHLALMSAMATFFVLGAAADAAASRMPAAMRIAVVYAGCAAIMRTRTIRGIPQVHKQA